MPTKRRHRPSAARPDYAQLGVSAKYELLNGEPLIGPSAFPDQDAMQQAWELHREELLSAWIAERPGTRPFAWWLFEGVPEHGERPILDEQFARLHVRDGWTKHGILHTSAFNPATGETVQEPERDFLARHGELTPEDGKFMEPSIR